MDSSNWRIKRDPSAKPIAKKTLIQPFQKDGTSSSLDNQRQNSNRTPSHPSSPRDGTRAPLDRAKADQAIEEGRRVWVGNLPYKATIQDIESLFTEIIAGIEGINISVDPMTGRNPSYCFIDFNTKIQAEEAMAQYNGINFMSRPLKMKPGVKPRTGKDGFDMSPHHQIKGEDTGGREPVFDRWRRLETPEQINLATEQGRRLWIGSLPRFHNQAHSQNEIRNLFEKAGFEVEAIRKVVSTKDQSSRFTDSLDVGSVGRNRNYSFVDLKTVEDARSARNALDGRKVWGGVLRVDIARDSSSKGNGPSKPN